MCPLSCQYDIFVSKENGSRKFCGTERLLKNSPFAKHQTPFAALLPSAFIAPALNKTDTVTLWQQLYCALYQPQIMHWTTVYFI